MAELDSVPNDCTSYPTQVQLRIEAQPHDRFTAEAARSLEGTTTTFVASPDQRMPAKISRAECIDDGRALAVTIDVDATQQLDTLLGVPE